MNRQEKLILVSKRLIIFTGITLFLSVMAFALTFLYAQRFMMSWFCFECGIIGGFVSIQQRLKRVEDEELEFLSRSWIAVLVVPVFGGVFALLLYLMFLSGIVQGYIFPAFSTPEFSTPPTTEDLRRFFTLTYPKTPEDFAKFAFWSFVAGFSERFVPQIIQNVIKDNINNKKND